MSESAKSRSARRFPMVVLAGLCAAPFLATPARAAVTVNDFEGAPNTPDSFPGAAGNGWNTLWNMVNGATGVVYAGTVANTTPINASPNYLSVSNTGSSAAGTVVVRRVFGTNGDVDPAQPHRVAFQFRFDGDMANFSGSFNDRINLFADPGGVNTTAASNAWMIGVAAASNGTSNVVPAPNTWFFFDAGNETGSAGAAQAFTGANLVNTGITLTSGTVYSFAVDVYPALGKYDATISNGTQSFTGTDLQFRNLKTSTAPLDVPDTLHFGIQSSAATDNHAFSLDPASPSPPSPSPAPSPSSA